jgi:hypothetical protein
VEYSNRRTSSSRTGVSYYKSGALGQEKVQFGDRDGFLGNIFTQVKSIKHGAPRKTYSSGRRNSKPNKRISPTVFWRKTLAVMGGVSLGTRLEEAGEGAGMVR